MRRLAFVLSLLGLASAGAACSDFRTPGDLRYARVLAVRATPPRIAPGQRARIDLLVTADDGSVTVRAPDRVLLATPPPGRPVPPPETALLLQQEGDAWYVNAPTEEALALARAALGLPADAPLALGLETRTVLALEERVAEKIVLLGGQAGNPVIVGMTANGILMTSGQEIPVPATGPILLDGVATGDGQLSYAWFAGFGKVEKYLQPTATLSEQKPADKGALVLIVRDDRGGVDWLIGALRVP